MGEDLRLPERTCARTPMQWSTLPQAGFSTARRTAVPVISGGAFGYERVNVADQRRDHGSLLNWLSRLMRMRKECPQISWGDFVVLEARREVLAVRYDWEDTAVLALHNLSGAPVSVRLRAKDTGHDRLVSLLDDEHGAARRGWHTIELDGFGFRWFRVGGLDDILRRRGW
jgi:maltose alpha-D-glucosyltransferase/alpha-amylase